jgi:hypothetical protein
MEDKLKFIIRETKAKESTHGWRGTCPQCGKNSFTIMPCLTGYELRCRCGVGGVIMSTKENVYRGDDTKPANRSEMVGWCRKTFGMLQDGATWVMPKNNFIFRRVGDDCLVLMATLSSLTNAQRAVLDMLSDHFNEAGIEIKVTEETH